MTESNLERSCGGATCKSSLWPATSAMVFTTTSTATLCKSFSRPSSASSESIKTCSSLRVSGRIFAAIHPFGAEMRNAQLEGIEMEGRVTCLSQRVFRVSFH
jgi:hypothetical protein